MVFSTIVLNQFLRNNQPWELLVGTTLLYYCRLFWNKPTMNHESMGLNWAVPCYFSRFALVIFGTASSNHIAMPWSGCVVGNAMEDKQNNSCLWSNPILGHIPLWFVFPYVGLTGHSEWSWGKSASLHKALLGSQNLQQSQNWFGHAPHQAFEAVKGASCVTSTYIVYIYIHIQHTHIYIYIYIYINTHIYISISVYLPLSL